jgi:hypothetical protein
VEFTSAFRPGIVRVFGLHVVLLFVVLFAVLLFKFVVVRLHGAEHVLLVLGVQLVALDLVLVEFVLVVLGIVREFVVVRTFVGR